MDGAWKIEAILSFIKEELELDSKVKFSDLSLDSRFNLLNKDAVLIYNYYEINEGFKGVSEEDIHSMLIENIKF